VPRHAREQLAPARVGRLSLLEAQRDPQRVRDQRERRSRAHRIGLSDPDLDRAGLLPERPEELLMQPRLAETRRGRHHPGARRVLLDAAQELREQLRKLPLAPHAGHGMAK
jgi:hypothetical protein